MTQKRSVQLSSELCDAAERRYRQTFASIEELLETALRELVSDASTAMDDAEERLVEQRLRELGYL